MDSRAKREADYAIEMANNNNKELIAVNVIHIRYLYSPSYVWRPISPNTINSIIKKQEEEAQISSTTILILYASSAVTILIYIPISPPFSLGVIIS
jgi:hypothetical protein